MLSSRFPRYRQYLSNQKSYGKTQKTKKSSNWMGTISCFMIFFDWVWFSISFFDFHFGSINSRCDIYCLVISHKKVREITWNIMNARKLFSRIFLLSSTQSKSSENALLLFFKPRLLAEIRWFSSQDYKLKSTDFLAKITSWKMLVFQPNKELKSVDFLAKIISWNKLIF